MDRVRPRWLAPAPRSALRALPVVVLTGARQTGKTTLAQSLPRRAYLSLDDLGVLGQARSDPESLFAARPLTLDEVQRAPELLLPLKRQVDRGRRAGEFLLTGSANLLLMAGVADSLAGRAAYLELPPFCPAEWLERAGGLQPLEALWRRELDPGRWPEEEGDWQGWLLRGGFAPALAALDDASRGIWFGGYVQTYLERDLRQLSAVASLPDFQRLMALAAHRAGRLLNQSELGRDAALPQPTVHRHMNLLETGCLIARIAPYASNPATGLVKTRKLYWTDCGLAAWLANIRSRKDLQNRMDQGFWLEQTIFQSLQSWRSLDAASRRIWFWRDRSGREVDFVLEKDGALVALDVKASRQVGPADASGIAAFRSSLGRGGRFLRGVVLHGGSARPLAARVHALPWSWLVPRVAQQAGERSRAPSTP